MIEWMGDLAMSDHGFFESSKEQSRVKAQIVSKYFEAWAMVMMSVQDKQHGKYGDRIAYIDLFAGPGRYDDGTQSTPLMILEKVIANDKLRGRLVSIFNDKDENNTRSLEEAIENLPGIDTLRYPPQIRNQEIGSEIVKMFDQMRLIPTFFFVDPWGYKGLSLQLINVVLKNWGCDCVFFFNYNRISMGLPNEIVEEHMNALFGQQRADNLRETISGSPPAERELMIVEELCQAIKETGKKYVLPFRFKNDSGTRTSHHLIFVSKDFRGYDIMKDIMARESSSTDQGVASFEYSPATVRQPFLFQLSRPLDDLEGMLLENFAGRTLTRNQIYQEHNVDRPYIPKNYRDALLNLEAAGQVLTDPASRKKGTFGPNVKVTFPAGSEG
jgi:three-Cys-motif partner protein